MTYTNLQNTVNSRPHDQPGWEGQSNSPSGTRYNNTFKLGDISGRAGGFSQNISVQVWYVDHSVTSYASWEITLTSVTIRAEVTVDDGRHLKPVNVDLSPVSNFFRYYEACPLTRHLTRLKHTKVLKDFV